jgi:hypothetical protein
MMSTCIKTRKYKGELTASFKPILDERYGGLPSERFKFMDHSFSPPRDAWEDVKASTIKAVFLIVGGRSSPLEPKVEIKQELSKIRYRTFLLRSPLPFKANIILY